MASPIKKIAYFLSGHGFGHGVRNSAVIEALPPDVEVDIYTSLPESFFSDELHRPFRVIPCEIDCGCLQTDTVEVDIEGTLARYLEIETRRKEHVHHYAPILRASGADLVIADTPPLALAIARAAGVPSWCVCNFTWLDIYADYVVKHPRYLEMFQRMLADYALADRHIRIFPFMQDGGLASPADGVSSLAAPASLDSASATTAAWPVEPVGMVCRPGRQRRDDFARRFGLDPEKKWCLIYVGSFGLDGVDWHRLSAYPDWEFMGLFPLEGAPPTYKYLKKDLSFRYADLNASCDLVLGKLGYGLVAECLAQAKPVLFLGRKDFSEFAMLKQVVESRGLGREIPLARFLKADFGRDLEALTHHRQPPLIATGVSDILRKMGF